MTILKLFSNEENLNQEEFSALRYKVINQLNEDYMDNNNQLREIFESHEKAQLTNKKGGIANCITIGDSVSFKLERSNKTGEIMTIIRLDKDIYTLNTSGVVIKRNCNGHTLNRNKLISSYRNKNPNNIILNHQVCGKEGYLELASILWCISLTRLPGRVRLLLAQIQEKEEDINFYLRGITRPIDRLDNLELEYIYISHKDLKKCKEKLNEYQKLANNL